MARCLSRERRCPGFGLLALLLAAVAGCGPWPRPDPGPQRYRLDPPSERERYCAWYGDAAGGVLYFGVAPFWSTYRAAGGQPAADLRLSGPVFVGRFDLRRRHFLPPLDVRSAQDRSGVWDVLARPDGRIYFTTFFGSAGVVEADGRVRRFEAAGSGLNELFPGPDGSIFATRYGHPTRGSGSVVKLGPGGEILAEHALWAPEGYRAAAKSLAWDPRRDEIWVNTDLLPEAGGKALHDARVLGADGRQLLRITRPELQFVSFDAAGGRYAAMRRGPRLELELWPAPGAGPPRRLLLDRDFDARHDFVQDIKLMEAGAVVTRWSGVVHVVGPDGRSRRLQLPREGEGGLYYSAVLSDGGLCATLCDDVSIVCAALPD